MEIFTWIPDHEYAEDIDFDVDVTQYISGKKQRYLNNPDPVLHKFYLSLINRSNSEIQDIVNFLRARKGGFSSFLYAGKFEGDYAGTADSGTTTRLNDTALNGYSIRFFCKRILKITAGTNAGQERVITISESGYVQWVEAMPLAIDATSQYVILYKVNLITPISPRTQTSIIRQTNITLEEAN
jgi:phage-related protein